MSGESSWLGSAADFGKGVGQGVWDAGKATAEGIKDLVVGGYEIATDEAARDKAWNTTKQVAGSAKEYAGQVYDDPAKALRDARDGANSMYTAFDKARQEASAQGKSAEFWGNAVGKGAFEVGAMLIPVGAASKAGKLGKLAKAADKLDDVADTAKGANTAKKIADGNPFPTLPRSVKGCPLARPVASEVAGRSAVDYAKSLQGKGVYKGVDDFTPTTLKPGDIIVQGDPGPGDFYTTMADLEAAGKSREKLFQGLQVEAHPEHGYRPRVKVYRVKQETVGAIGEVGANPQFGPGGAVQVVVKGKESLEEIGTIDLGP